MVSKTTFGVHSPLYSSSTVCVCLLWASFLLASFHGLMGARVPPTPACKVPPPSSETFGAQSVSGNKIRLCSLENTSPSKAKVEAGSIKPPPTSTKKVPPSPEAFSSYNGSSLQNQNYYYDGLKNTTANVTSTQTPPGLP